ncbi:TIGR02186 family protein [Roseiarcaceae bacterium H3SJ34-1]|uniref:TIGR02186 family protein n=1 Tax=Terripilifer ovatus TaxID=3032367 RepID=UPI003AB99BF0|nr:TIGR02186 family protein [Roseiarcaceae bacterium H3SJ34-1]
MKSLRALVLLCLVASPMAHAETLVTSLSRENVLIQSNFAGERLSLFGVIDRGGDNRAPPGAYDAVVTVRGPRGAVTVRRKDRFGPMWLNLDERRYIAIPAFLEVLSNRALPLIAQAPLREELRLGLDAQVPQQIASRAANDPRFRDALQRLRKEQDLFRESASGVKFIAPNVFQAAIELPGKAPIGNYDIDVAVFVNGALVARGTSSFRVAKTAVEQTVATLAADHGVLFGIGMSILSLFIGWLASVIFRRD